MVFGAPQDDWFTKEQAALAATPAGAAAEAAGGAGGTTLEAGPGLALPAQASAAAPAPRRRGVYAGVYENRYYGRVTVRPGPGDGLAVRLGHGVTLRYVPWSADVWRDTASGTAAVFDVHGGRARRLELTLLSFDGRSGAFARVR